MRKLKLQVQLSLDGFMSRPDKGIDFIFGRFDPESYDANFDTARESGLILLGGNMPREFITHWQKVVEDPTGSEYAGGRLMVDIPKVVISNSIPKDTPAKEGWLNTEIMSGDLATAVNKLKQQPGKDILVYGGIRFATSLIKEKLVDEYYLFINPVAIGKGLTIFDNGTDTALKLVETKAMTDGTVLLKYVPA